MDTSKLTYLILALCMILVSPNTSSAQEQSLEAFVQLWLLDNCDLDEPGGPENTLLKFGSKAEDLLIVALEQGPTRKLLDEQSRELDRKWNIRQEILATGEGEALGKENWELATRLSKENYVTREQTAFKLRYRDRAIQGLATIATKRAIEVLEKYASDSDFELQDASRRALRKLKQAN